MTNISLRGNRCAQRVNVSTHVYPGVQVCDGVGMGVATCRQVMV